MIPPDRGLWIPPGMPHRVHARGVVEMRTLYLAPDAIGALPESCCVLITTPLMRQLILAALEEPVDYDEAGRGGLIFRLMQDELARLPRTPLGVPMPRGKRLKSACELLIADPASSLTLEALAREAGASPRTLAREFAAETGLSFTAWRNRLRLSEASALIAEGSSVAEVARACGYGSPSAFTAMMRRTLGAAPQADIGLAASKGPRNSGRLAPFGFPDKAIAFTHLLGSQSREHAADERHLSPCGERSDSFAASHGDRRKRLNEPR